MCGRESLSLKLRNKVVQGVANPQHLNLLQRLLHTQVYLASCSFHTLPKFHKLYSESKTLFAGNIVLFCMYLIINISFRIMNVPVVYLYADAISFGMQEEFYFSYT